jgi:hypothetical protein
MRRIKIVVAVVCLGALLLTLSIAYFLFQRRDQSIQHLFAIATSGDSQQAQRAIEELGAIPGEDVSELLMRIASGEGDAAVVHPTVSAIQALANRHDDRFADDISMLVQPHEHQPVKLAAAIALRTLECRSSCIARLMHYLERMDAGELTREERRMPLRRLPQPERAETEFLNQIRQDVDKAVYEVLRSHPVSTLETLQSVYGLGGPAPSIFALKLTADLDFRPACGHLLSSRDLLSGLSAEDFEAPREQLARTLDLLQCQ